MIRLRSGSDPIGTLSVGALPVELHGSDPLLRETIETRYRSFFTDELGDLTLEICPLTTTSADAPAYQPEAKFADGVLTMRSEVLEAEVDFPSGRGTIAVRRDSPATQYYLENALRQIVQILALERDAILLHAASVAPPQNDRTFLFAGRSGAGKSTISGILRDAGGTVLSDDLVLLETRADLPRIVATPFYGTLAPIPSSDSGAISLPLSTAYLLEQAEETSVSDPLPRPIAVAALLTNVPFTQPLDPTAHQRAMDVLSRATRVVPVRKLRFRRDDSMLPLLGWEHTREELIG